jgi:hypothetical protein
MKNVVSQWSAVLALMFSVGVTGLQADDRNGEVLYAAAQESSLGGDSLDRPGMHETAGLPLMIREKLRLFEEKREAYLAEQLDLLRQLRGASSEERARLREQLREQRKNWLEEAKQIREQARVRLQEMKQELANHGEVIEAARERARERAAEGAERARERRGTD